MPPAFNHWQVIFLRRNPRRKVSCSMLSQQNQCHTLTVIKTYFTMLIFQSVKYKRTAYLSNIRSRPVIAQKGTFLQNVG